MKKNVYKWRIINTKYAYITDENNVGPFIYDKITGIRTYFNGSQSEIIPNDATISNNANALSLENYTIEFNRLKTLCQSDQDGKKLVFLSVDNYYNLESQECVEEAVLPVCEGYDPVLNVTAQSVGPDEEASAELKVEKIKEDKTIHYDVKFYIPKGESGLTVTGPIGPEGPKGENGKDAKIGFVGATAVTGYTTEVSVETAYTNNELNAMFNFVIEKGPKGEQGDAGPKGDDGRAAYFGEITATSTTLNYWEQPYVNLDKTYYPQTNVTDLDFTFGLPKGEPGERGYNGLPALLTGCTASITMVENGNPAGVTAYTRCVDTYNNKYGLDFKFEIPRAKDGTTGGTGTLGLYNFGVKDCETTKEEIPEMRFETELTDIGTNVYYWFKYPESWGQGGGTTLHPGSAITIDDEHYVHVNIASALTETVIDKKETPEKNFIHINEAQNALEVLGVDTDCDVISNNITINGGPLADKFLEVYTNGILPSGETIQQMLINLLCRELWAEDVRLHKTFTTSINQPGITSSPSSNKLPVGSKVTFTITPSDNTTATQKLELKTMTYGYNDSNDVKHTSDNITETYVPANDDTRKMVVTSSKFKLSGGTTYAGETTTQGTPVSNLELYVDSGDNTISAQMVSGRTFTADTNVTEQTIKVLTNLGNIYKQDKTTIWEEKFECPDTWKEGGSEHTICPQSTAKNVTITGYYPYYVGFFKSGLTESDITKEFIINEFVNKSSSVKKDSFSSLKSGSYTSHKFDRSCVVAMPETTKRTNLSIDDQNNTPWGTIETKQVTGITFSDIFTQNYWVYYISNDDGKNSDLTVYIKEI